MTHRAADPPWAFPNLALSSAILIVGLAACSQSKPGQGTGPRASLTITTQAVRSGTIARRIEASGTIVAWQDVTVAAETGGLTAVKLFVEEGDTVRKGQLLVQMNDSLLRAQFHQREASLASAKAVLAQANADLKRAEELKAQGYLAQASLDQKQAAQQTAAANMSLAQAALNEMSVRLAQASLRAPVAGLIAERHVVTGQIIEPSKPLFRIVRDGRLELNAQVPEANLSAIRAGQKAMVSSNELGSTPGHVRLVTPQVDPQTRVGLVHVALDRRGQFRPGMFGKTVIDTANAPALLIPQASVLYRDNKPGVFVIDAKKVAHFRGISTGTRSGDDVEVLSGLAPGDAMALQGAGFLAEGDQVRIVNATAGAR